MKKKTRKKIFFWTSVIVWIISAWVIFVTQSLTFLKFLIGENNVILQNPVLFSGLLLVISNGYIIWAFVEKKRFPPY